MSSNRHASSLHYNIPTTCLKYPIGGPNLQWGAHSF